MTGRLQQRSAAGRVRASDILPALPMQLLNPTKRRVLLLLAVAGMAAYVAFALAVDAGPLAAALHALGAGGVVAVHGLSLINYLLR